MRTRPTPCAKACRSCCALLYPVAPHITHALWRELGFGEDGACSTRRGREVDAAALEQDEIELVVQVNGKLRGTIRVPKAADKAAIESRRAGERRTCRSSSPARTPKKVIVVPGRLVNIVV